MGCCYSVINKKNLTDDMFTGSMLKQPPATTTDAHMVMYSLCKRVKITYGN
jgi:hypothetical protein